MISLNVVASGLRNGFLTVCSIKALNTITIVLKEKGNIDNILK